MRQVVDTETAEEFMKETLEAVDVEELGRVAAQISAKSDWFQEKLSAAALPNLSEDDYTTLLRRIFAARRKLKLIRESFAFEDARDWMGELLHGDGDVGARFQNFVDRLDGVNPNTRTDIASELLHFTFPDRYWLWTRWMWNPRTRTGALPLVTSAAYDLSGEKPGEVYPKVGKGIEFVHEVGQTAGFQTIRSDIFGTDVYLSCVYVIYAYTALKMRMTQEFNKVMPEAAEFCRRLLGVQTAGAPAPTPRT